MTLTQGREAQAVINVINSYDVETQAQLEEAFEIETQGITDETILNAIKSELGL